MEISRTKTEKRLDKIEEAWKKESRTRLIKEKLCAEIHKYDGLWLMEEQIESKLEKMETDSGKRAALKCPWQYRQKVISVCPSDKKKLFFFWKGSGKVSERVNWKLEKSFKTIKKLQDCY